MVSNVAENFDIYLKLGPRRVVFHLEAFADLDQLQEFLEGIDPYVRDVTEIGVAIGTNTDVEKVFKIVNSVDFVQCMGIENIGFQGQEFDERVLEQIQKLRAEFPDLVISVDGSVTLKTAPKLIEAGATRLVVGSAIFNTDDIIGRVETFRAL